MELRMKYHYSYFIYPYVIKKSSYNKYIQSLLKNNKCKPRYFEREKDLSIYNFFLPTVRDYMFKSFNFDSKVKSSMEEKFRENMLKSSPCAIFEYKIGEDAQAKTGDEGRNFL